MHARITRSLLLTSLLLSHAGCGLLPTTRQHHHGLFEEFWQDYRLRQVQDSVDALPAKIEASRRAPMLVAQSESPIHLSKDGRVHTRLLFAGGQLQVVGRPRRSRTHVLLALRPLEALGGEPCDAKLFLDGEPLHTPEVRRTGDRELLMTLAVDDLARVSEQARFVGYACARSFELDRAGRATLRAYALRFREQLALLHTAPANAVLAERAR